MSIRLRYKIYAGAIVLLGVFILGRCGRIPQKPTGVAQTPGSVFPPNDAEQITVNPATHQLIILRPNQRIVETLPDRASTIDIRKDGRVVVTSKQFGLEHHMFIGLIGAEHIRIGAGLDGLYYKKLDLGIGIADQAGMYTPIVFVKATYNIKGNLQIGLVYQSNQYVGGVLSARLF